MATAIHQNGKASTIKSAFSRVTSVSVNIKADPSVIWALLTNASDYPKWNSTVISIDGKIAIGEKINLKSPLDPKRVFKLKVKDMETNKRLVWVMQWVNEFIRLLIIKMEVLHFR
jgi:uncharacterized protein YndB with AHSA1/START domain